MSSSVLAMSSIRNTSHEAVKAPACCPLPARIEVRSRSALQDNETADLIDRRDWKLVDTYTDHGVSGSRAKRPELDRMLVDAHKKRFDAIVVYKADRLFRSMKHMVVTLDELSALGIEFVSAKVLGVGVATLSRALSEAA